MAVRTGNDWATWSYQDLIDTLGTGLGTVYAAVYGKLPGQTEPVQTFSASPEIRTEAPVGQMPSNAYQQVQEAMAPNIAAVKEYMKTEDYRLQNMSVADAKENIRQEIANQQKSLAGQGVNWNSGISVDDTIDYMAGQLAKAGVKTIYDLEVRKVPGPDQVIGGGGESGEQIYGPGPEQNALINKRTGQAIPPEYAFAQMGDTGGTWGGTFAGEGSTRFNVNFVDGVPVFTAQQQATVKSGLEKLAGIAAPIALGFALGPAGLGLSSTAAGALAGGVGGLLKSGDIEDALKGAALGGALAYGKEALFGAGTAASDLAQIEASMGTPSLLGSSNILDAVNQAATYAPEVLSKTLPVTPPVVETISGTLSRDAFSMLNPTERGKYLLDMATKRIPTDLSFDFNMDGKITPSDALLAAKGTALPSLSTNIPSVVNQAATVAPDVLPNISPEAVANLGALESSLGTTLTNVPTTQAPIAASDLAAIEASMGVPTGVGVTPGLLANISPEIAATNLGALESSLGTPSLPVTQLPTGVSPSDLAAIEASMGPGMQLPTVSGLQAAPKLEDIFSGFGDYNEAAQNLLGQAQQSYMPFADTSPTLGALINEPVRVPGDTRLVDTIAQPPLAVEDISGQLSPEAKRLMGMLDIGQPGPLLDFPAEGVEKLMPRDVLPDKPTLPGVRTAPDLPAGNLDKGVLLGNEGYGPISDQTVTGAPITTSPITSLGPAATLKDITDYLTGGAFAGTVTDAFKEAIKAATGGGQQQQGGGGLGGLGPIIGGLLSRSPTAAPSASVTPGRPVDIISPIQSLLAPKLVQQRPVTLL
jgi:hypothetical protein